ncbi:MAG TPA: Ldh family oxidoreductase [Solirubrobacteraceae bacterium]|jgi:LDH2 family malate/lactate/ureidoglycolate dehydrogenase
MANVHVDDERDLILDILRALRAPEANAQTQTRWLIEADLRGHSSHGLQRLPVIAERIARGLCDPAAEPALSWASPAALVVDGRRGLGPCAGLAAVDALIERAPGHGVAVAAVHNANHLGLLAGYVERCAEHGLIGVALTTSEALVHPWGGRIAAVGTNPIAVAVPAHPDPFVLDMATGRVSMGKILDHRNRAVPLEPGWALDGEGRSTLDAAAAANGSIAPFGGPKGYALGVAFELLVGAMTGTALGRDVAGTLDTTAVCNKGDMFVCLDPRVFGSREFVQQVTAYLQILRDTPPQDGSAGVLVPGDRARAARAGRLEGGIVVADGVWAELRELRARLCKGVVA